MMTQVTKSKYLLIRFGMIALLAAAVLVSATAAQADPAHDYRRTLFISFGQKSLLLEAPKGMCFLDQTDYLQRGALALMQAIAKRSNTQDGVPMAIFGDCNEVMSLGTKSQQSPLGLAHRGVIYWDKTAANHGHSKLGLSDYLDMREASLLQEVKDKLHVPTQKTEKMQASKDGAVTAYVAKPQGLQLPTAAHRTANSVSVGYTQDTEIEYSKFQGTSVLAATLLRQMPIDVLITYMTPKRDTSLDDMYQMMDTFMDQQQRLNRE